VSLGAYGGFIVPAYAATAIALVWMVIDSLVRARAWRRKAEAEEEAKGP
jgi:heme exporter protein CcmD